MKCINTFVWLFFFFTANYEGRGLTEALISSFFPSFFEPRKKSPFFSSNRGEKRRKRGRNNGGAARKGRTEGGKKFGGPTCHKIGGKVASYPNPRAEE